MESYRMGNHFRNFEINYRLVKSGSGAMRAAAKRSAGFIVLPVLLRGISDGSYRSIFFIYISNVIRIPAWITGEEYKINTECVNKKFHQGTKVIFVTLPIPSSPTMQHTDHNTV